RLELGLVAMRRMILLAGIALAAGVMSASAQAPDIPAVIKRGTQAEVVVKGLRSADDPIWVPGVGLLFTESANNRVVRLTANDTVETFGGELHGPLGMTLDRQGSLISLQPQAGCRSPWAIWPGGRDRSLSGPSEADSLSR